MVARAAPATAAAEGATVAAPSGAGDKHLPGCEENMFRGLYPSSLISIGVVIYHNLTMIYILLFLYCNHRSKPTLKGSSYIHFHTCCTCFLVIFLRRRTLEINFVHCNTVYLPSYWIIFVFRI